MADQERGLFDRMLAEGKNPLFDATRGLHRWIDPGMDDFERGWEEFAPGQRVEIRTETDWLPGIIRETPFENDRAIVVECDEPWHANMDNYQGRGATIPVIHNTRRGIWSSIRTLPSEPQPAASTAQL